MLLVMLLHWMTQLVYPAGYEIYLNSYDGTNRDIKIALTPRHGEMTDVLMHIEENPNFSAIIGLLQSGGEDNGWKVTTDKVFPHIIRIEMADGSLLRSIRWTSKGWNPVIKPIFPDPPKP